MLSEYSYSCLETYRSCPRQFCFQYVDKASVTPRIVADTYLGSAVHRALRKLYTLGSDGVLCPLDDIVDFYRGEWEKVNRNLIAIVSDYHTVDDYIRVGEEMLVRHYERHKPFDRGTLLGAELYLRFGLPGTRFRFRAVIDRLWRREDGVVEICDYKTGQYLAQPQDPRFRLQMGLYQLAVQASFPQFEEIELAQYFVRMDEVVRHRLRPEELEQVTEEARVAVIETTQAARLSSFPSQEGPQCNYCRFLDICPAKKHRKMLERDAGVDGTEGLTAERIKELANQYIAKYLEDKRAAEELAALRSEIVELARQTDTTSLEGDDGRISIRLNNKEKFVTRSADADAFARLSFLSRQLKLDDYFVLDANGLMKEIYQKQRLPEDQLARLAEFVVMKEEPRVTVRLKHESDNEGD